MSGLFEPKDEVSEATKFTEAFRDAPYGSFISWEDINSVVGRDVQINHGGWQYAIFRLVRDHDRVLKSVRNAGYQVLIPDDVEEETYRREKRALRQLNKRQRETKSALPYVSPEKKRRLLERQSMRGRAQSILRRLRRRKPDSDDTRKVEEAVLQSRGQQQEDMAEV